MTEMLTTADVAKMLQVAESTVRHWRRVGEGPRYAKINNKVRYHPRDVDRWWTVQVRAAQR